MTGIKIDIHYTGGLCKSLIFDEVEYPLYMNWKYGINVKKDMLKGKKLNGQEFEYWVPKTGTLGKDEDDYNLQIEEIIVQKGWMY